MVHAMNAEASDVMKSLVRAEEEEKALIAAELDSLKKELGGVANLTAKLNESNTEAGKKTIKKTVKKKGTREG